MAEQQRISTMTELVDINAGDYIEVSEDDGAGRYNTKKYDLADIADAEDKAHTQNSDTNLGVVGTKTQPVNTDKALYRNSANSDALVTSTWAQIKAFFKTDFDALYSAITHASAHADGTDDIQSATNVQKGLATASHITTIEANTSARHTQNTDTILDEGGPNEITAAAIKTLNDTTVPAKTDKLLPETLPKTADHILALADADKVVVMNKNGEATVTVPANADVAFPVGTRISIYNASVDSLNLVGATGVTVRNAGLVVQYGEITLRKRATDEWVVFGEIRLVPPTGVKADVVDDRIVISFNTAWDATSYNVYMSVNDGAWTLLDNTTSLSYSLSAAPEPGEYNFYVTSVRGDKESVPSSETVTADIMFEQVYSDTITDLRISAVDGTAFVDGDEFLLADEQTPVSGTLHIATKDGEAMFFHDSIDFSAYAGTDAGSTPYRFVFTDAAGKKAEAWGGAVGGGETLGSELVTNGDFEDWSGADPDGWTSFANGTSSVSKETTDVYAGSNAAKITTDASTSNVGLYSNGFTDNGSLYVISVFAKSNDATKITIWPDANNAGGGLSGSKYYDLTSTYTEYTFINTARADTQNLLVNRWAGHASMSFLFDNVSAKKCTDIPATGLHLMSSMNGTTRNMASVDVGFNPNTVTSVKVYHALADGNHLLEIEDSLGNVASGVLSAQGSGETLGSELVTNGTFDADTDWDKGTGWLIEDGVAKCDGTNNAHLKQPVTVTDLWLTKASYTVPSYTSGLLHFSLASIFGRAIRLNNAGDSALYSTLLDADNVQGFRLITNNITGWLGHVDNISFKQVTAPSTSGALIVSEIDGATRDFVSIPAGFQFNRTSYICRVKKILPTA